MYHEKQIAEDKAFVITDRFASAIAPRHPLFIGIVRGTDWGSVRRAAQCCGHELRVQELYAQAHVSRCGRSSRSPSQCADDIEGPRRGKSNAGRRQLSLPDDHEISALGRHVGAAESQRRVGLHLAKQHTCCSKIVMACALTLTAVPGACSRRFFAARRQPLARRVPAPLTVPHSVSCAASPARTGCPAAPSGFSREGWPPGSAADIGPKRVG